MVNVQPTEQPHCWLEIATLASVVHCIAFSPQVLLLSGYLRSEFLPLYLSPHWGLYVKESALYAYPFALHFVNTWTLVISSELLVISTCRLRWRKPLQCRLRRKSSRSMIVVPLSRTLPTSLGKAVSTIGFIMKNREKLKTLKVAKGVTLIVSRKQPQIIDEVEKLLLVYINEKQHCWRQLEWESSLWEG